ncbi:COG1030 Membrane-bound serine protease (ClpP class) [Vibrio sp. B1REV9]|nr:COG1030 Membrane-bound serine protease (ClpP class) [Vibrio sp. B1REV9]
MKRALFWFLPLVLFASQTFANSIWIVPIKGAIGPATSDYLVREIEEAQRNGVSVII